MRLRRASPDQRGWTRRRAGRGWVILDATGTRVAAEQAARVRDLVIPPAWADVWICPWPNGHIQAVGVDAAGRRQYLYHPEWRKQRDLGKFDRLLTVAKKLPAAREQVIIDLDQPGMPRERALAAAFRMLDLGYFRVGGESYTEQNGTYGLATLRKSHVQARRGELVFSFVAKSGKDQEIHLRDPDLHEVITRLRARRGGNDELLAYQVGRRWRDVTSTDINEYVKSVIDGKVSAKDFRTWHATVLASIALARPASAVDRPTARRRAIVACVKEVSEYLGNTPTVARTSYIDPRVIDKYEQGVTIAPSLKRLGVDPDFSDTMVYSVAERAVARMLRSS